ncbi:hypothetical protein XBI1_1870107 [Xenorhabdus bovienii str. Intermedium]|uniref:Uncharacterized protein n=1 Tax=Xenorhabdus bovienii str. Intermedium TaxID=1379677 RepID=A0A077QIG5_XENBV|nr:hypothetical protein XBI1_1870107 [Xenorhabdus bovienii str. Intermedium]
MKIICLFKGKLDFPYQDPDKNLIITYILTIKLIHQTHAKINI